MNCKKLHEDIEQLKTLRKQLSDELEKANESGKKEALPTLSQQASDAADEILEYYAEDIIEQDEKDEKHPNAEFIKTIKERLGYVTDDTTIDQIRNNLTKYLKHDLDLSSNLLAYALKEKSNTNQQELSSIFQQLNLEPDKINEIMERLKNLEVLETEHYTFLLPKDKWEKGKIKLPNPENDPGTPEYIAPTDFTAILKGPVYYDWRYETDGRATKYGGDSQTLVYDEKWVGKEIRHFPWSKELIREANEKLLKPNGFHIPEKDEWATTVKNLTAELAREKGVSPNDISDLEKSLALQDRLNLALSGSVLEGVLMFAGEGGLFWSSSEYSAFYAYFLAFISNYVEAGSWGERYNALSVRCVS